MKGTAALRISLLGELAATYDDAALDLGGPRQRAVLALLVLARGEVVPAERLADSLWGEQPPASAAGALQSYVSHLRRRLQPGAAARERSAFITSEGRGYAVRLPRDAVDAWRFESLLQEASGEADAPRRCALLDEAIGLWRGPALAEYADEPWAEAEVVRLTELRTVAREQQLAARLEIRDAALLVPELEALVADQPLREERWRLLVLALYRAHRQADALGALRRARTTLADELGVDPGPALRALEAEVLAQSPALDVPLQRPGAAASAPPGAPLPAAVVVPAQPAAQGEDLVDREHELSALRGALDAVSEGEPGLLLVEGPAGIGKSRLLAEARRMAAAAGCRVLSARGSQLESAFGFGVVRQLLEPALAEAPDRDVLLSGSASSARGVFDLLHDDSPDGSFAVLHGLYWLAVSLAASRPLVLAVDDLQWADAASLRYLGYLARRLEGLPVLLLGTVRTGEEQGAESLLQELAHDASAVVVRPGPLSLAATAGMVERRLGQAPSPLFVAACHRTTSGNPLLLRQLLRALEADGVRPDAAHADVAVAVGSRAVSSMVGLRLRRMPADVAAVARAAAVLGDGAALPAVAALAEVPEPATAAALAALARAEVVRDEQPLAFVHPLVRDAVYRDLPAAERELLHEGAARLLGGRGASDEHVAAHLLLSPRRGDAATVRVLRRAARTAAERGAADSAVTYLRRALDEPATGDDRRDVLLELGLLESLVDGAASTDHLEEAYALLHDERTRAEVAIAIARTQVFACPPGVATAFAHQAVERLPGELVDQRQGLLALERISALMHGLERTGARGEPLPEPVGTAHGARMLAAAAAFEAAIDGQDRERAVALARFALEDDRLWPVDSGLLWVVAANVRVLADDDLGDFWPRARAAAHARGSLFAALSTSVWQAFWHWRRGELKEALAGCRVALDQTRMWGGTRLSEGYTRAFEVSCHLERGDLGAARSAADAALQEPAAGEAGRLLHEAVARLLVAEGRPVEALEALRVHRPASPVANPVWDGWRGITASALHGLGRTAEALALAEEETALLRLWGAPSYLGASLRLLGELRGADGTPALREAAALLSATSSAVEHARAQVALASQRDVDDDEAVPLLEQANLVAQERGARLVRDAARAELVRRGREPDTACDEVRWLSRTERRVLELASSGLRVHEVAQQLFLTPGTVRAVLEAAAADALP